jgi:hypothetical protein
LQEEPTPVIVFLFGPCNDTLREEQRFIMRTMLAAAILVLAMLALALPAAAQEEQGAQQAYCDWYWDYTFVASGGWEYWCWDPQKGWWFGQREDGKAQRITM